MCKNTQLGFVIFITSKYHTVCVFYSLFYTESRIRELVIFRNTLTEKTW